MKIYDSFSSRRAKERLGLRVSVIVRFGVTAPTAPKQGLVVGETERTAYAKGHSTTEKSTDDRARLQQQQNRGGDSSLAWKGVRVTQRQ